jgi:uncharacterized protein
LNIENKMRKVFYLTEDSIRICALLNEPSQSARASIVLAHGITSEKTEDGIFTQLAESLCLANFNVLLFDFRGHGESGGRQQEMTILGEVKDLTASLQYAQELWSLPTVIVAASFGAVSTLIYSANKNDIPCIVLWNPVLDLPKTFLEPTLPWAQQSFNPQSFAFLKKNGYLLLDEFFKLGQPLIEEMSNIDLDQYLQNIRCPTLTIHGDRDTYVPYDIARKKYQFNYQSKFLTVPGSEHGFGRSQDKELVISNTVIWVQKFT